MSYDDSLIGKKLGDYEIRDLLGRGGMARVYRGYDANLERFAAVKVFDAKGFNDDELEEYRERFQREARAIARLRHPQIVNVYQTGQDGHYNYMAMMFIEGRDLRQILKDHVTLDTRMTDQEILRIITDIADALDYAHAEGVIHRDVKPSNIMVTGDGRAILTDFGLALNVPDGTIGTTFGTVHYIAPEQAISSAQAVPQSDLYSLGVVLYEMLVGRVPFDDQSAMSVALRHISDPPPPPSAYRSDLNPAVEKLVLKMLSKDPEDRCQSGKELVVALEAALQMVDESDRTRTVPMDFDGSKTQPVPKPGDAPSSADNQPIPAAVIGDDQDPTLVERSKPSVPQSADSRSRSGLYVIGAVALLFLLGAAALLLAGGFGGGGTDVTATTAPTRTAVAAAVTDEVTDAPTRTPTEADATTESPTPVALAVTASDTATVTDAPALTPTATATATATVTDAPLTQLAPPPTSLATATPDTPTPDITATPSATEPTATMTATAAVAVNADAQVMLIYDGVSLTVYNRSDEPADISDIRFVQTLAEGGELVFLANRWGGGTEPVDGLSPGDCFQVWTFDDSLVDAPQMCDVRHAWRQVSSIREFWISDLPGATFAVVRDDAVLAECAISAGECLVDVRR